MVLSSGNRGVAVYIVGDKLSRGCRGSKAITPGVSRGMCTLRVYNEPAGVHTPVCIPANLGRWPNAGSADRRYCNLQIN